MNARLKSHISAMAPYRQGKTSVVGIDRVIKLSSNELPYPPSPAAVAAFHGTASSLNRYPDGSHADLRKALAAAHALPEHNLFAGNGSEEAIGLVVRAGPVGG